MKRDWRKNVVVAGHFADNPASGQVLCKAGFLYTGDVELRPSAARGGADVPDADDGVAGVDDWPRHLPHRADDGGMGPRRAQLNRG